MVKRALDADVIATGVGPAPGKTLTITDLALVLPGPVAVRVTWYLTGSLYGVLMGLAGKYKTEEMLPHGSVPVPDKAAGEEAIEHEGALVVVAVMVVDPPTAVIFDGEAAR